MLETCPFMPLHLHMDLPQHSGALALWAIEESEVFFQSLIEQSGAQADEAAAIGHPKRRLQHLAARYLLLRLLGDAARNGYQKDHYGKPHLIGLPCHISLSHSHDMVAVAYADVPLGIDVQLFTTKIERIANKFMTHEDLAALGSNRLEELHAYWGAKECLYKGYGRRELDFKTHIFVAPFQYEEGFGRSTGRVSKNGLREDYMIFCRTTGDYMLVGAFQK